MSHYKCGGCGRVASTVRGLCIVCHSPAVIAAAHALDAAEQRAGARFDAGQRAARRRYITEKTKPQRDALAAAKRTEKKDPKPCRSKS